MAETASAALLASTLGTQAAVDAHGGLAGGLAAGAARPAAGESCGAAAPGAAPPRSHRCQVPGCPAGKGSNNYSTRYRLCFEHQRASEVWVNERCLRFCYKCSRLEPVAAFAVGKHTCTRMLAEHSRRRRQRAGAAPAPAVTEGMEKAQERRSGRERQRPRRAGEQLDDWEHGEADAAAGTLEMEREDEATAAAAALPQGAAWSKPRAVWGDGEPADYLAAAAPPHFAPPGQLHYYAQQPPGFHGAPHAPHSVSAACWFDLINESAAASALRGPLPGACAPDAPPLPAGYPLNAMGSALTGPSAHGSAGFAGTLHLAGALPFDAAAFAAALQRTAANNPSLAAAAAAAAQAAAATQPTPAPTALPDAIAELMRRLRENAGAAAPQQAAPQQYGGAGYDAYPGWPPAAQQLHMLHALPAAPACAQPEPPVLAQSRFPSGGSSGGAAPDAVAAGGAQSRSESLYDAGAAKHSLPSREQSSARSGQTAAAAPGALLPALAGAASVEELVREASMSGGGAAAQELRDRLRRALEAVNSSSAGVGAAPAGATDGGDGGALA